MYSPYDRDLLAVYDAIKYFRHMVEGQHFVIFTITSLLLMLSNDAINACHDNSVIWSLLENSLPNSGMSRGKTMLRQTHYRQRSPFRRLLITMLLRVPRIRMRSCKTF